MAFKMKGHVLPGINQRSEGNTDLKDGRSKSASFQQKKEIDTVGDKQTPRTPEEQRMATASQQASAVKHSTPDHDKLTKAQHAEVHKSEGTDSHENVHQSLQEQLPSKPPVTSPPHELSHSTITTDD